MPNLSLVREEFFSSPLTLAEALERVKAKSEGESPEMSRSVALGLCSAASDGVRQALSEGERVPSREEVMGVDIRQFLPVLHTLAEQAAIRKGHQAPGDHASRAARWVEALTGERYDAKKLSIPVPDRWKPLVDALPLLPNARSEIGFLARACTLAGEPDAPEKLPPRDALNEASLSESASGPQRISQCGTVYRRARRALLDGASGEEGRKQIRDSFAPFKKQWTHNTSHLGIEDETYEIIEDILGRTARDDHGEVVPIGKAIVTERLEGEYVSPEDMNAEQLLRVVAPIWAFTFDTWTSAKEEGVQASSAHRNNCWGALQRVAGWVIRHGRGADLETMHLDDLIAISVEIEGDVAVNKVMALRRTENAEQTRRRVKVSLLEALVEQEAEASLGRSTVAEADVAFPHGRPWITDSIRATCERVWAIIWSVFRRDTLRHGSEEDLARWGTIEARWNALFEEVLVGRALPPDYRTHGKDIAKMIRTVTLPQLVCVGLPLRRREIKELQADFHDAREKAAASGYDDPDGHRAVKKAAKAYFEKAVIPHLALCLPLDDGLRKKQYSRGRPGTHFQLKLRYDDTGNPTGISEVTTSWTPHPNDVARYKNRKKAKTKTPPRDRDIRGGYVDLDLLWDFISWQRPRDLLAAGKIETLEDYDLERDLRGSPWALFPSPSTQTTRQDQSRQDLSAKAGQELHHVVRTWLRPELPTWNEIQGDPDWRELWAMHITRTLIASYWGGVRDEWGIAEYLTTDSIDTLKSDYNEVAHEIRDRLGHDSSHWEHPHAYDAWMDRLYRDREVFDPPTDPDLPLPAGLRDRIKEDVQRRERAGKNRSAKIRIRTPRPGQKGPGTPPEGADRIVPNSRSSRRNAT